MGSVHEKVVLKRLGPFPEVSRPVFIISAVMIFGFILYGTLFTGHAEQTFGHIKAFIAESFGWFYFVSVTIFLVFVIWLGFSRYGDVRLGDPNEEPRFSLMGWFAMLFSAGMGIGLLFWGVAEPMNHYRNPPLGEGETLGAAKMAVQYTFFHWGLHAWAIYSVIGMAIAYFCFRQKLPLAIRSVLYPLLGERIYGWPGHVVDIFAVLGTMFGVSTSLGLGVMQINSGLAFLSDIPESAVIQVVLIAIITGFATLSVVLGLYHGIQRLSQLNLWLSLIFLGFLALAGPSIFLIELVVEGIGIYLQNIVSMSLWNDTLRHTGWQNDWTTYYWGWWIAWSPFVGMFIARVSRGRTIREFVVGVLFAPVLFTFLWLSLLGGNALHLELFDDVAIAEAAVNNVSTALFVMLQHLPLADVTAGVATLIVVTYFVTSSDSGSLVIDMLTAGGHTDPPKIQRIFWAVTEGVVASVLLLAGGLNALQTASITAGLPFCVIVLLTCWSLVRGLRTEPVAPDPEEAEPEAPEETMG